MKLLNILKFPNKTLFEKAENINKIDENVIKLINQMIKTMFYHKGIGIAAPQVNIKKNIIIICISMDKLQALTLINPNILFKKNYIYENEGCLSFPGLFINIKRNKIIKLKFININGEIRFIKADKLISICLQHEIDHLHGITLYNKMSSLRKKLFIKNLT